MDLIKKFPPHVNSRGHYGKAIGDAARRNQYHVIRYFMDNGFEDYFGGEMLSPLFTDFVQSIAAYKDKSFVKDIVNRGFFAVDRNNNMLLRQAARDGDIDFLNYLIKKGVDIHYRNDIVLQWAKNNKQQEMYAYLQSIL